MAAVPARVRAEARVQRATAGGSLVASVRLLDADGAVVAALDGVRFAPADPAALARAVTPGAAIYELAWQPAPDGAPTCPSMDARGCWIVLADGGLGETLVGQLDAAGGSCLLVGIGERSNEVAPDRWVVAPGDEEALAACLAADGWRDGQPVRGIVHAWALAAADCPTDAGTDWLVAGSALQIVQELGRHPVPGAALWLVTHGAQAAAGPVRAPGQAGLWGLAAAVTCEHPELACRALDLDPDDADPGATLAAELLGHDDHPSRLALRAGRRLVPRLRRYGGAPQAQAAATVPEQARLVAGEAGTFDALTWRPSLAPAPGAGEVRLRVLVAGLNFRDVLLALGVYPGHAELGSECVGVVEAVGDRVARSGPGRRRVRLCPGQPGHRGHRPGALRPPGPLGARHRGGRLDARGLPHRDARPPRDRRHRPGEPGTRPRRGRRRRHGRRAAGPAGRRGRPGHGRLAHQARRRASHGRAARVRLPVGELRR